MENYRKGAEGYFEGHISSRNRKERKRFLLNNTI